MTTMLKSNIVELTTTKIVETKMKHTKPLKGQPELKINGGN
jgi:hypothetical protein